MSNESPVDHRRGDGRIGSHRDRLSEMERAGVIKWLLDLLSPGDRVRHIAINGGVENGGMDIAFEKCADDDPAVGRLLTRGENGEPVWTRVKWTISKAEKP